jgi:hypothetical protein
MAGSSTSVYRVRLVITPPGKFVDGPSWIRKLRWPLSCRLRKVAVSTIADRADESTRTRLHGTLAPEMNVL